MKKHGYNCVLATALVVPLALAIAPQAMAQAPGRAQRSRTMKVRHAAPAMSPRFRFENFTTANGLPDNHVYAVLVDGDRVWAGTENGLAV